MTCSTCSGLSKGQTWALIALGSNIGDSVSVVQQAFDELRRLTDHPMRCSSLYRTEPVDCPPGSPSFINAMVALIPRPGESPESLLAQLQALETACGRLPKQILNEPRPLDLDLIAFGIECRNTPQLALPHPRALRRRFVLEPLAEIDPDYVFPGQSLTATQLIRQLETAESVQRISS